MPSRNFFAHRYRNFCSIQLQMWKYNSSAQKIKYLEFNISFQSQLYEIGFHRFSWALKFITKYKSVPRLSRSRIYSFSSNQFCEINETRKQMTNKSLGGDPIFRTSTNSIARLINNPCGLTSLQRSTAIAFTESHCFWPDPEQRDYWWLSDVRARFFPLFRNRPSSVVAFTHHHFHFTFLRHDTFRFIKKKLKFPRLSDKRRQVKCRRVKAFQVEIVEFFYDAIFNECKKVESNHSNSTSFKKKFSYKIILITIVWEFEILS